MRMVTAILFLFIWESSIAQKWPFEYWHDGRLVLETGDTLKGKIKYDIQSDIIQLDQKGVLQSFTGRKIIFYEILDVTSSHTRQFYSIPFSQSGGYKSPTFFELLSEGKLTLLAKEALEYQNYSYGYYGYSTVNRLVLVNKYFVLNDKGEIEPFSGSKNDLMDIMSKRDDEIRKFIKVNRLSVDRKYDLARVFDYYNSLMK